MKNIRSHIFYIFLFAITTSLHAKIDNRWEIQPDGSIVWKIKTEKASHYDHIEMSGKQVSIVLRYGINANGEFSATKGMVWPLLRTIPNNTHASLMRHLSWNPLDEITIDHQPIQDEKVESIMIKGMVTVKSRNSNRKYEIIREYLPSTNNPTLIENYYLINIGTQPLYVEIPSTQITTITNPEKGVEGSYRIENKINKNGFFFINPQDTLKFTASTSAYKQNQKELSIDGQVEKVKRMQLVSDWMNHLVLETPDETINQMFAFSKIRAWESIYETKGGPMHGPGGESFYAAIWANDQAEYINPYFPFTGYEYGCSSALNSFMHFARFMNSEWKPIPSSIIAEGIDIWNGAGDRGDGAMIAYGASRYALARGSIQEAKKLWPLITWCLEYCNLKLNKDGVVSSDSDELEGRFPAGKANLCTSSLYYDALISASFLANELGEKGSVSKLYLQQAKKLRQAIEKYFGAKVEGFNTYAYYKGNDILRSWICIPLTVGINERAKETINALSSPRLWTKNGLLTEAGDKTFWDRSTLYAIRGIYMANETSKATDFLKYYSNTRLLGEHVPYAIEAWPEGNQRHLSAESGLYGRIITEGLFGIRPIGLRSFELSPKLPEYWQQMKLKKICAFGKIFDIEVYRKNKKDLTVKIISGKNIQEKSVKSGQTLTIHLK